MNRWLFEQVNAFARATPWLHAPARAFAAYGVVLFAVLLVAGWWVAWRSGRLTTVAAAISAGGTTLLAVAVNQPIVHAVHEARPYASLPGILVLANRSTDPSFPSDHATMAGAVAAGLWIVNRRLGIVASVAAVLMAVTRVYIAAHYPADVAAGLLLGAVVAVGAWLLVRRPLTWAVGAVAGTRLRAVLVRQVP
ncbi:undecaprenyl-diphosphatase/undecaprenyl-diphosphatase [Kribbella sp. VKM Ac-2571]|uniref:phosphatase PAP2 family protein n=1 Tax=Kribbella sp. VKM Ac-2571 TaxID=2512222 RepID=UPI00105E321E|nr:phosphatase PAP2 family protein [Kribbella sp. VKM Ac-2571]TDO69160.1 undecaprenyl-diphosphatase/undecaprenyl-diphosphatase [Kribbella sp. VKM Ac-2571]